jgi:hypothetical protein
LHGDAKRANELDVGLHGIRDMAFQCAIFQTSAALESYLKLSIEGWAQALKTRSFGNRLPIASRGYLAAMKFQPHFQRFAFENDETRLISDLPNEHNRWPILDGPAALPTWFDGKLLHEGSAYPSFKNLKRLFYRLGVSDFDAQLGERLQRDVELMIKSFQDIRTALAHAAPPTITFDDVSARIKDMCSLVAAIDRILYSHIIKHGGADCWAELRSPVGPAVV